MYGIILRNFQKRIQNVYKTYSFRIQISYRDSLSSPYHSQNNGLVECFNRTLCEGLAKVTEIIND